MPDADDELSQRDFYFNEQRASLRSDTSPRSSNARPRSRHQSLLSQRASLPLPRTAEDLHLHAHRADSDTLPSPPGSPSPAPAPAPAPASREQEKRKSKELYTGRDSATSWCKSRTRATSKGRNAEHGLVAAPWDNQDFLASPPPEAPGRPADRDDCWPTRPDNDESSRSNLPPTAPRTPTKQRSPPPSGFSRSNPSNSPQSQNNITALPSMTSSAKKQLNGADRYHQSWETSTAKRMARCLTKVYTISFLVFFAIWGTLARLGLQALTSYPGAPLIFSELWANVAGSFVMGFLSEDTQLFREEWGSTSRGVDTAQPEEEPAGGHRDLEKQRDRASHSKVKKTIPLYVGLTTGFCGSFTSFSSFVRDVFLGMSNDLPAPAYHPTSSPTTLVHRDAGYSVMALLAVVFITVALCYCALRMGAHLAVYLDPMTPTLPFRFTRRVVDPLFVFLGIGSWVGAVAMAALPPHNTWRGQALFACVFAPLGCLARYYISQLLNAKIPSFPLGTFACNLLGTAVLGMAYDLQRVAIGGVAGGSVVGCQVLQGIQDGFCGALTTVSTWMLELDTLRRTHAYVYGTSSVVAGLSITTVIMGSVRWSIGWEAVACAA